MKRYMAILCLVAFIFGCAPEPKNKIVLAKIGAYEITKEEFEQEFMASTYAGRDTLESRKEFLNNLINRKLILQDAQKAGLDKDKAFLKDIERFWEQSLLKLALEKRAKEIVGSVMVTDKEVEDAYKKMRENGTTAEPYNKMYQKIKWGLSQQKESQVMDGWIVQLRKDAKIQINENALKMGE